MIEWFPSVCMFEWSLFEIELDTIWFGLVPENRKFMKIVATVSI